MFIILYADSHLFELLHPVDFIIVNNHMYRLVDRLHMYGASKGFKIKKEKWKINEKVYN